MTLKKWIILALLWIPPGGASALTVTQLKERRGADADEVVVCAGYYAHGDGGGGQFYWAPESTAADDGVDAGHPGLVIQPNGHEGAGRWIRVWDRVAINVRWFGAKGDGGQNDQPYIQRAIDVALYSDLGWGIDHTCGIVRLPQGVYRTEDTIHLGYGFSHAEQQAIGRSFTHVTLAGTESQTHDGVPAGRVQINAHFADRPIINIAGGRGTKVRGLAMVGGHGVKDKEKQVVNSLPFPPAEPGPLEALGTTGQNNFFCAIAQDAYCGAKPKDPYPAVTFPAALEAKVKGGLQQYGKEAFSSFTQIEDCFISHVVVGVASRPSTHNSQGDFLKVRNCWISHCKVGVDIQNHQSRVNTIEDCEFEFCYYAVGGAIYGAGFPQDIYVRRCSSIGVTVFLQVNNPNWGGMFSLEDCYAESLGVVAIVDNGAYNRPRLVMRNCHWNFAGITGPGGFTDVGRHGYPFHLRLRRVDGLLENNMFRMWWSARNSRPLITIVGFSDTNPNVNQDLILRANTVEVVNEVGEELKTDKWKACQALHFWNVVYQFDGVASEATVVEHNRYGGGGQSTARGNPVRTGHEAVSHGQIALFREGVQYEKPLLFRGEARFPQHIEAGDLVHQIRGNDLSLWFRVVEVDQETRLATLRLVNYHDGADPVEVDEVVKTLEGDGFASYLDIYRP